MIKYFTLIFLSLLFVSQSAFATKKMVFLGDSLTEGLGVAKEAAYPALLQKKIQDLGKDWEVVNSGISGATSASAISRMKWILKSKPDVVVLALGANDGLRGVNLDATEKNLDQAIELGQKNGIRMILCGLYMPPNYGKDYTTKFKKIFEDLARKRKIKLIPFLLANVAGNSKFNQADGIHPNEAGHKMIAEQMLEQLKDVL